MMILTKHAATRVVPYIYLLAFLFASADCSDSTAGSGWQIGEDGGEGYPVRQGIYTGQFRVVQDGCEPTLQSVIDQRQSYPLPDMPVWVAEGRPGTHDTASLNAYSWRDGLWHPVAIHLDQHTEEPQHRPGFSTQWPTMLGFDVAITQEPDRLECQLLDYTAFAQAKMVVTQPARDTIQIRVASDWSDVQRCTSDIHYEMLETLPKRSCHEVYIGTYTLDEPCPAPCEPDVGGGDWTGITAEGLPAIHYDEPPTCRCPDASDTGVSGSQNSP